MPRKTAVGAATPEPEEHGICPGCGRCNVCGRPAPGVTFIPYPYPVTYETTGGAPGTLGTPTIQAPSVWCGDPAFRGTISMGGQNQPIVWDSGWVGDSDKESQP